MTVHRELHLVHPIGRIRLASFRWVPGKQEWQRDDQGNYRLFTDKEDGEFFIPASNVRCEKSLRTLAAEPTEVNLPNLPTGKGAEKSK